jgi:FkbM family methyltransferase
MIQKFKTLKMLKLALTNLGYFVGSPKHNGEFKLVKKIISHYDLFLDIGFHKGEISEYVRNINKKIVIFGFDYNINFSKEKKNSFSKNKISFFNFAISDKTKKIRTYNYPSRPELSSLRKRKDYNPNIIKDEKVRKKKSFSLDQFSELKKIKKDKKIFLKIDTDGSEKLVINGMKKLLSRKNVSGYFEYSSGWKNFNHKLKSVFYFLKKKNFSIYRMTKKGLILMRYFSELDENYFQSHYFFVQESDFKKFKMRKSKILSLTSDKKECFYII